MTDTTQHARDLGYHVVEYRRCSECDHYPGQSDLFCRAANRHASKSSKRCRHWQPVYETPGWLK